MTEFLNIEKRDAMSEESEYLNSKQAVQYLCEKWGMESYSEDAFRALVRLRNIKADLGEGREAKRWKRSTLDKIYKPSKSNPRKSAPKRRKKVQNEEEGERTSSVLYYSSTGKRPPQRRRRLAPAR
jgi:hypothetical protein